MSGGLLRALLAVLALLGLLAGQACLAQPLAASAAGAGIAQPLALPAAPAAKLEQRLGERLPLDIAALDEVGRRSRLGAFFDDGRAVLLVPGYYRCPQLCGLVMHGLLEALAKSGIPREQWRVVAFSIDPQDTAVDARARRDADLAAAASLTASSPAQRAPELHLLVLARADIERLTQVIGYSYERQGGSGGSTGGDVQNGSDARNVRIGSDPRHRQAGSEPPRPQTGDSGGYAHPASVVLLTPQGTISRYFNGLDFDAQELRVAVADAQGDRIGGITSRIALLCAHFDPRVGRWTGPVMNAVRLVSLLLPLMLALWLLRRRRAAGGPR